MATPDELLRDVLDPIPAQWSSRNGLRDAAVLAGWWNRDGVDHLVFTKRRDDLTHHAGQVSFPGGAREHDEDPVACALREAREEVGLPPDRVVVLGALPPRLSVAGFWVHVLVGRVAADIVLQPDPREVDRVLLVPVADLDDPERWTMQRPRQFPSRPESPHFEHDGETLWGLTARLTLELLDRIRGRGRFDR